MTGIVWCVLLDPVSGLVFAGSGVDWSAFLDPLNYLAKFGRYVVPFVVLQTYLSEPEGREPVSQMSVAALIVVLSIFAGAEIVAAKVGA